MRGKLLRRLFCSGARRMTALDHQVKRLVDSMQSIKPGENQYLDRLRAHFVPTPLSLPGVEEELKEAMASSLGQAGLQLDYEYLKFDSMKASFKADQGATVTREDLERQIDKIQEAKTLLRIQRESMGLRKGQTINTIYPSPVLDQEDLGHQALKAIAKVAAWQSKGLLRTSPDFDLLEYLEKNGMVETFKLMYDAPLGADGNEYEYSRFHSPSAQLEIRERVSLHMRQILRGEVNEDSVCKDEAFRKVADDWIEELLTRLSEHAPDDPFQASLQFAEDQLQQSRVGWKRPLGTRLKSCFVICAEGDPAKRIGRSPVVSDEGRENLFRFGQQLRSESNGICFPEEVFARSGRKETSLQSTEAILHGICGVRPMPTRVTRKQMKMSPCAHWNTFEALFPITPNPLRYSCMMGELKSKDCPVCCIYSVSVPPERDNLVNPNVPMRGAKDLLRVFLEYQRKLGPTVLPGLYSDESINPSKAVEAEVKLIEEHKNWLGFDDVSFFLYTAHQQKLDALSQLLQMKLEPGESLQALTLELLETEQVVQISLYVKKSTDVDFTTKVSSFRVNSLIEMMQET